MPKESKQHGTVSRVGRQNRRALAGAKVLFLFRPATGAFYGERRPVGAASHGDLPFGVFPGVEGGVFLFGKIGDGRNPHIHPEGTGAKEAVDQFGGRTIGGKEIVRQPGDEMEILTSFREAPII